MYKLVSNLILYSNLGSDSILSELCDIFRDFDSIKNAGATAAGSVRTPLKGDISDKSGPECQGANAPYRIIPEDSKNRQETMKADLTRRIYSQIKRILDISTEFGFDKNLWHDYLTFVIISNKNSFSLTCEGAGATAGGSVNGFVKNDLRVFKELFDYDFSEIENFLDIDCFTVIENYTAIAKHEYLYDKSVSAIIRSLSERLAAAKDTDEFFDLVCAHYRDYGVGMFGLNRAFRIRGSGDTLEFVPISNADAVKLDDLVGYERQKEQLCANTGAFCAGHKANNVLLYGDPGTGKSSSIKAVLNEYFDKGLRMIEIYKHQFKDISNVIALIKKRNYKFIIYIDDLSFEENEVEYKFLKAVIEGGVENRPDNILIYATSNRRHLVKETWKDRNDMEFNGDVHSSETMSEKLSLASRFGVTINYPSPDRQQFYDIVTALAKRAGIDMDEETLLAEANKWELRHGGVSGRTAQQFITYTASK